MAQLQKDRRRLSPLQRMADAHADAVAAHVRRVARCERLGLDVAIVSELRIGVSPSRAQFKHFLAEIAR
ncbi:hypothetical protein GCM10010464_53750 [Pseudonocardia yunnanensis]